MAYWLLKSEPDAFSWDQLVKDKTTSWTGVRNYTARNNLKAMKKGDQGFFYHSNEGLEIVGVAEVTRTFYPDPTDKTGKFVTIDVKPVKPLKTPVSLKTIKADKVLRDMVFAKQGRLSVSPVTAEEWNRILDISNKA
jgi:predicted RNA-binding protein with PUA-like domain